MRAVTDSDTVLGRSLVDTLIERYVSWREACCTVRLAYQWWAESDGKREVAYAGYLAALDCEELAARNYAEQVKCVTRMCT
jgi:hypothetical protein